MLSKEFLLEKVQYHNWVPIGVNLIIGLSDHYFDRLEDRGLDKHTKKIHCKMSHNHAMQSIKKLGTTKLLRKIGELGEGDGQFYVVDHTLKIILGLRRQYDRKGKMCNLLGTIITPFIDGSMPEVSEERARYPVIDMA